MMPLRRYVLPCCLGLLLAPASLAAKKPLPGKKPAPAASAAPAPPLAAPAESKTPAEAAAAAPEAKPSAEATAPAGAPAAAAAPTAPDAPAAAAAPPAPAAQPTITPEQLALAKQHFDAGTQAFAEKRYEVALNEFTTSFEISKEPDLLYNLYRVAVRLEQKEMALNYLREYVRIRPEESPKLQPEIDQLTAPSPPPAAVAAVSPPLQKTAPRWPGAVLLVLGGASAVTGSALLIANAALPVDDTAAAAATASDRVRSSSLTGAGAFLVATGAVELIAGIAIYVARRPKERVALLPTGSGLKLVGSF